MTLHPLFPSTDPYTKPFKFCQKPNDVKYVFIGPVMENDIFISYCDGECRSFETMPEPEKALVNDYMKTFGIASYQALGLNPKTFFVKQMKNGVVFLNEDIKDESQKETYKQFLEFVKKTYKIISSFQQMLLTLTPLTSSLQFDGSIQMVARNEQEQFLIRVVGIEFSFYIVQPPGLSEDQIKLFENKVIKTIPESTFERVMMQDAEFFNFDRLWPFYKVSTSYKNMIQIFKEDKTLEYDYNMYFTQEIPQQKGSQPVCSLLYDYAQFYETYVHKENLKGFDYLAYEYCKFPFRRYQRNITSIQINYDLNFQDTICLRRFVYLSPKLKDEPFKRIEVNIHDIKQAETSELNKMLKYYQKLMFDIENVVETNPEKRTYTKWNNFLRSLPFKDDQYKKIAAVMQNTKASLIQAQQYKGALHLEDVDVNGGEKRIELPPEEKKEIDSRCCDQNEIVCISFIVSSFDDKIIKRIALVRSEFEPEPDVADEVIIAKDEKDLLQHTIRILGDKNYNLIQQFNGWSFDNKMIAARCLMYDLFEDFVRAFDYDGRFSFYNFDFNGRIKVNGQQDMFGLFQIKNPLRFCFDVFVMNKKMSPVAEKLEGNSLNALLAFYGLGSKQEGVSYQDISDLFTRYQELTGEKQ